MKTSRAVLLLGFLAALISGCRGVDPARSIEIGCDQFNQQAFIIDSLTVNAGDEFSIQLCSNPSTGFQWSENPENENPEILSQISHDFVSDGEKGTPLPPGRPGSEIWTFTALENGQSQLRFEYSRNWDGGEKGTWTYTIEVAVQ